MKKFFVTEDEVVLFANNVVSLSLCLFAFFLAAATAAFWVVLPALGMSAFRLNTDISLWPVWVALIVLFWSAIAAIISHLLGSIADDAAFKEYYVSKTVSRTNRLLLKGASYVLYPALLFWKIIIFTTFKIFRKK